MEVIEKKGIQITVSTHLNSLQISLLNLMLLSIDSQQRQQRNSFSPLQKLEYFMELLVSNTIFAYIKAEVEKSIQINIFKDIEVFMDQKKADYLLGLGLKQSLDMPCENKQKSTTFKQILKSVFEFSEQCQI
mmetsp:Transcript_4008/g.3919  ORF Transcript_4008/g.3919 Transcript_4008/m.3919 type:complete len:132 (-) Transcript_4008:281-676(-)